jgi:hypothetical protein
MTVASRRDDRLGEAKLCEAISDPHEPGRDLGRAVMDIRTWSPIGSAPELDVDAVADGIRARHGKERPR